MFTSTSPRVELLRPMTSRVCRTRYSNSLPCSLAIGQLKARRDAEDREPPPPPAKRRRAAGFPSEAGPAGGGPPDPFRASRARASLSLELVLEAAPGGPAPGARAGPAEAMTRPPPRSSPEGPRPGAVRREEPAGKEASRG